jgi:hypothetical protein
MQVTKEKMAAQQLVLFHLGYYRGNIDGIWSAATIEAKKQFEAEPDFLPAYPNGGLPFGERDKLPKNWHYGAKGVIGHAELSAERTAELLKEHEARIAAAAKRAVVKAAEAPVQPQPAGTPGAGVVVEQSAGAADTPVTSKRTDGTPGRVSPGPGSTNDPQDPLVQTEVPGIAATAPGAALSEPQGNNGQYRGNEPHTKNKGTRA